MTNEQILHKAICKAHKNKPFTSMGWSSKELIDQSLNWKLEDYDECFKLIFSHAFAKAFFGNKKIEIDESIFDGKDLIKTHYFVKCWEYHLMKMVKEKEPLKYLEKYL